MLVRRRLSLGDQGAGAARILRHEQFTDAQAAVDLLERAQEQVQAMLDDAQARCQYVLDQAAGEFWDQAGAFLEGLDARYRDTQASVIEASSQLLNLALERLFDEASPGERARVMVKHLAASQSIATGATLSCHPELFDEVQAWVAGSRFAALWQLREDGLMPLTALRLSSETGEFDLDWAGLQRCLLAKGR